MKTHLEIMDTTLRDGEQTNGVSYNASEKLQIAKLLLIDLKVNRIEIGSAKVSEGELKAVKEITRWAKKNNFLNKIEVLGFVDKYLSVDWIISGGGKVINLLTKGSLNHLKYQLKKTPKEHILETEITIKYAHSKNMHVNVYLEDWSNGMKKSKLYVLEFLQFLSNQNIKRVMLPDTLGILSPKETYKYIQEIKHKFPLLNFDFHAHNDYDLGIANTWEAINAGINGIHTTINGMGERAGNIPISSIIAILNDFEPKIKNTIVEHKLYSISKIIETFSGIRIPANKPIIGENVFTQTAGIHADGDNKKNLYFNNLLPERFGRNRKYALGKTSGKANVLKNIQSLGIQLDNQQLKAVTTRIIELGDKQEKISQEDLPYIISDVLNNNLKINKIKLINYCISHAAGLPPTSVISIEINKKIYTESNSGDGQFDAFMNALKKIYKHLKKQLPQLIDYSVRIPPGGKTNALCETVITWKLNNKEFSTRGLYSDQTFAAIKATEKMLNMI